MNCPTRNPEPAGNPFFNQNPPALDKVLTTRSSLVCGGDKLSTEEYNVGLHVMALFVVLGQSTLACAFPLIAKKFPRLRIPPSFLFSARHFGTGVLIATAFVHLLPTAFTSLTDPCLPAFWNETYPAMAGAIAMAAVFFVTGVEMLFTRGLCNGHYSPEDHQEATLEAGRKSTTLRDDGVGEGLERGRASPSASLESLASERIGGAGGVGRVGFGMVGRRRSRSHSVGQGLQALEERNRPRITSSEMSVKDEIVPGPGTGSRGSPGSKLSSATILNNNGNRSKEEGIVDKETMFSFREQMTPDQQKKKALLQCALLEMGILFHSVFIGMALSVTEGPPFVILLIAIVFHQTFEGLALGSRIAMLSWKSRDVQPWLMALAYGATTPVGQALGLGMHSLYEPTSQTGLLLVGIMNAVSSGLLVFAGLVELLAEDFLSDESWRVLGGKRRVAACVCVLLGAFGMAFVGAFA
ncbi:hypothetical protein RUND412_003797 [Rhizina undulata]